MPELAEVEWFRKQWNAARCEPVLDLRLHGKKRVFRGENVPAFHRLVGERLVCSEARGKRMLFRFSGGNCLGIHLGMTGKIHVESADFSPARHDHLVLFQRRRALVFTDSRQFGRVRFHHGPGKPAWWDTSVPEIISPEFDHNFLTRFLDRHCHAPIKAVLLMQNGFSGIGNWMADEILWRAAIHPATPAGRLSEKKRKDLFRATKFVANRSLETLGNDFSDPPRGWLIHQKWKRHRVCPKHRIRLGQAIIGGRSTVWCPRCQKRISWHSPILRRSRSVASERRRIGPGIS
jgi:formamidopyrimidine-DNA glycosylase